MTVLVIAEHNHTQLKPSTLHTIAAAQQLSNHIIVLVAGYECQGAATQAAKISGITKVWVADNRDYQYLFAEHIASLIVRVAKGCTHILAPANNYGKNLLPRVSALLDIEQISDVCAIIDQQTYKRPIYAGNAIATIQSSAAMQALTVRTTSFPKADFGKTSVTIENILNTASSKQVEFVNYTMHHSTRPELNAARIIIAGGRGLKSAENFKLLESLADKLGAAIGATRAAVDAGFAPNDCQVGQTGKVVAPELYIAIGISGAIQHIAGMKDSKVVVAINKDPDAPIFKIADYGLVGDLFEILPELESALV